MGPMQCVGGLYLTVADSLAPLSINNNNKSIFPMVENKNCLRKLSTRFLVFSTVQKIVLSSSRGQNNFRGLEGSRPRPRTCGFKAKAKDLKMCPRGLHLCLKEL